MPSYQVGRAEFCGVSLECLRHGDEVWFDLRKACRAFGVTYAAHHKKLSNPERCRWAVVRTLDVGSGTGRRGVVCIDPGTLGMFVIRIHPGRVRPELRPVVITFQRQYAQVLYDRFITPTASGELLVDPVLADLQPGVGIRRPFPGHEKQSLN